MSDKAEMKIGVIGVGRLGKFHVEQYLALANNSLVGFFDINAETCRVVKNQYKIKLFDTLDALLHQCDAVSIVTPTVTHFKISKKALLNDCHIFIEKPITHTVSEAKELINLAKEKKKLIQVGHIERYNPAFMQVKKYDLNPLFIESHRLAPFHNRGTDVDVVLDLMIHDIDILLALMKTKIKNINAYGISVLSKTIDMANTRIDFDNGCIANLTASRISQKKLRKFRVFENKSYTTIDFLNPGVEKYVVTNNKPNGNLSYLIMNESEEKYILYDKPKIYLYNALKRELSDFIKAITNTTTPVVDGDAGLKALEVATQIRQQINNKKSQ